jgi:hypothetical protein
MDNEHDAQVPTPVRWQREVCKGWMRSLGLPLTDPPMTVVDLMEATARVVARAARAAEP